MGNEPSKSKTVYLKGPCMEIVTAMVIFVFIIELFGSSAYGSYACSHDKNKIENNERYNNEYERYKKRCKGFLGIYAMGIFITFAFIVYLCGFLYRKPYGTDLRIHGPNGPYEYFMFVFIVILMGLYCSSMFGHDENMYIEKEQDIDTRATLAGTQIINFIIMFICLILVSVYVGYIDEIST